jgi:hypothetical protein
VSDRPDPRLARLEHLIREQDEHVRCVEARKEREVAALKSVQNNRKAVTLTDVEQNRLTLLDRLADRCPDLGTVAEHEVEWMELPEGNEALVLDRSRFTEGRGAYFMLEGENVLAVGPLGPDHSGVIVIRPDGSRELRAVTPGEDAAGGIQRP